MKHGTHHVNQLGYQIITGHYAQRRRRGRRCAAPRPALLAAVSVKSLDAQEEALELEQDNYQLPIPQRYLWRTWAANAEGITGDSLLEFVNDDLFPTLKNLTAPIDKNPRALWSDRRSAMPITT